ncbi:MAG: DUF362 domain-containing protein [Brevinematales bacterium]|nr:DUF362 domain-containing protein [Brevinematales bacterium]
MDRREFFEKTFKFAIGAVSGFLIKDFNVLFSKEPEDKTYDLVAIKNGEVEEMFDEAIKHIGGMMRFVRKDSSVLIKPNIGFALPPERATTTNPNLVAHIAKRCFEAGAKKVYVFDNSVEFGDICYKNSKIEDTVKRVGATLVPAGSTKYFQTVKIPKAKSLKEAMVHEVYLEADILINVPILKTHSSTRATIGLKNNMGVVWDRYYWHRNDLHQCIADFSVFRKPELTVVDAYRVLTRNGPRGVSMEDVSVMKTMIVSPDPVAADAAGARILGLNPEDIGYIKIASTEKQLGEYDLSKLNIKRITL